MEPYLGSKINRAAGRVIKNPFVSVTIDVLMVRMPSCYTPGSDEHGPRFLTGGPGAAPGGVASKNGWVYMRVQEGFNFHRLFCVSVADNMAVSFSKNGLRERLRVCRGGSRNLLRGLKEGGQAMRGAMLCLSADLTTHAV